ncbi:hypothetical protein [Bradyrhizobium sp.]|uniref:hypothetical protein n=1 Tax=Bradyrhizobium sp. TaxID=376 RepID=UPI002907686E|nr:hypothetical protein [Bradyrhizobium sp.]MDU6490536.1 hypothetical protein [Bradyrhizobium sp.]
MNADADDNSKRLTALLASKTAEARSASGASPLGPVARKPIVMAHQAITKG